MCIREEIERNASRDALVAAQKLATGWKDRYERLKASADTLAAEREALLDDVARFTTELTAQRARAERAEQQLAGLRTVAAAGAALADVSPEQIDAALAQQTDPAHGRNP